MCLLVILFVSYPLGSLIFFLDPGNCNYHLMWKLFAITFLSVFPSSLCASLSKDSNSMCNSSHKVAPNSRVFPHFSCFLFPLCVSFQVVCIAMSSCLLIFFLWVSSLSLIPPILFFSQTLQFLSLEVLFRPVIYFPYV